MFFNNKKEDKRAKLSTQIQLLEADVKDELNVLTGLENKLQHEGMNLTLIDIESMRFQIQKNRFDIIRKREELGHLKELLEIENDK
jgi:hypothetical protein